MAIISPPETLTVRRVERTTKCESITPQNGDPVLVVYREKFLLGSDDAVLGRVESSKSVQWSTLFGKTWQLEGGAQITGAQLFEGLELAFDEISQTAPIA